MSKRFSIDLQNFAAEAHVDVEIIDEPVDESRVDAPGKSVAKVGCLIRTEGRLLGRPVNDGRLIAQRPIEFARAHAQQGGHYFAQSVSQSNW